MRSRQEQKAESGARPFLAEGEDVLAVVIAARRGYTQTAAGAATPVVAGLGAAQQGRAEAAAEQVGLRLESPMALVLTPQRLITFRIGTPIGLGIGGKVKDLLSAVPIGDVDSIKTRRLLLGYTITITVRGTSFKLEANALAGAKRLVAAFDRAKATA